MQLCPSWSQLSRMLAHKHFTLRYVWIRAKSREERVAKLVCKGSWPVQEQVEQQRLLYDFCLFTKKYPVSHGRMIKWYNVHDIINNLFLKNFWMPGCGSRVHRVFLWLGSGSQLEDDWWHWGCKESQPILIWKPLAFKKKNACFHWTTGDHHHPDENLQSYASLRQVSHTHTGH